MSKMIWIAVAALTLAGCAPPPPVVTATGAAARLAAPARFDLGPVEPVSDVEAAAARAVTERLASHGWVPDAAHPDVLVEVAYAAAPQALGVHAGDARPETPADWLEPPTPRRWWRRAGERHALSVRLVEPATGRTVAVSTAAVRAGARAPAPVTALADALAEAWTRPTADVSQAAGNSTPKAEPSAPAS